LPAFMNNYKFKTLLTT